MKYQILKLLESEDFISGEKLAKEFGISRTAIWKHIKNLKENGYKIESVKNKGYRLVSRPDILLPEEIMSKLNTKSIGDKIHYLKTVDSTNAYAKRLIEKGACDGTIIVSEIQTNGRGRMQRSWYSPEGGLWFSLILYPNIPPSSGMIITMAASLAVADGIKNITDIESRVKWPNDLLIDGKKVCGILTELDAEMDKINYMIIGIGVNVNNTIKNDLRNSATNLMQKTKNRISLVKLLQSILKNFDNYYTQLKAGEYTKIRSLWLSNSNIIGKEISVKTKHNKIEGIVTSLEEDGCLLIKTPEGNKRIISGDVIYHQ